MEVLEIEVNEQKENEGLCIDVEDFSQSENVVNVDVLKQCGTTKHSMVIQSMVTEPIVPDITKFNHDVQHGYRVYCQLLSDQYRTITQPFLEPVDVKGLGLWDYHDKIETPMSFTQIGSKFKSYLYQSITEVISDIRLILENCYRYNGLEHWVSKQAQKLENILDQKLALLNRSLRDKVTLQATMSFRGNKTISCDQIDDGGCRRRRSGRTTYGGHPDQTSRLVNHLMVQKEEIQKEMKKMKEKEKKEAHGVLMVELNEWENEIFTPKILNELHSLWEVPSIGSFLWLFQEVLNLPELNYSEFEYGLIMPHKSKLIASIFSVLLSTPSQRKTIHKRPPMTFCTWHKKLKDRLDYWYMTRMVEEFKQAGYQIGLDGQFFQLIGATNPLENSSYVDLTLHQRVVILKVLCDECLDYDYQLRDYLGNADTTPFREVILGHDDNNYSYIYFPIFDVTDIRIYKQAALPTVTEWYKKWKSNYVSREDCSNETCVSQSESRRKSRKRNKSKISRTPTTTIPEGFALVCRDVVSLRDLCAKFGDNEMTCSGKKRRGRPLRKPCEKALHRRLTSLLDELCISEARYSKARTKAMLSLMKDWKTEQQSDATTVQEDMDVLPDTPELITTKKTNIFEGDINSSLIGNYDDSLGRITRNKLKTKDIYGSSPKTPYNHAEKKSTFQESTIQGSVIQEGTIKEGTIKGTVKESAIKESTVEKDTIKEDTIKEGTIKEGTIIEGTIKEGTIEEITAPESTTLGGNSAGFVSEENTGLGLENVIKENDTKETPVPETPKTVGSTNNSKMILNDCETNSSDSITDSITSKPATNLDSNINASSTTVSNSEITYSTDPEKSPVRLCAAIAQNEMTGIIGSLKDVKDNKGYPTVNGSDCTVTSPGNLLEHGINGSIMDKEGPDVHQNGNRDMCNGPNDNSVEKYEPRNKKHCSVDNHIMVTDSKLVMTDERTTRKQKMT